MALTPIAAFGEAILLPEPYLESWAARRVAHPFAHFAKGWVRCCQGKTVTAYARPAVPPNLANVSDAVAVGPRGCQRHKNQRHRVQRQA